MNHKCHAIGCLNQTPPTMLMCKKHWMMVPKEIQKAVKASYRQGQCKDKRPGKEWLKAARMAITHVATAEAGL